MSTSRPLYKSTSYERPVKLNFLGKLDGISWQLQRFLQTLAVQLRVTAVLTLADVCCRLKADDHGERPDDKGRPRADIGEKSCGCCFDPLQSTWMIKPNCWQLELWQGIPQS